MRKKSVYIWTCLCLTAALLLAGCNQHVTPVESSSAQHTQEETSAEVKTTEELTTSHTSEETTKESTTQQETTQQETTVAETTVEETTAQVPAHDFGNVKLFDVEYSLNLPNSAGSSMRYSIFNEKGTLLVDSVRNERYRYGIFTDAVSGEISHYTRTDYEVDEASGGTAEIAVLFDSEGNQILTFPGYVLHLWDHYVLAVVLAPTGQMDGIPQYDRYNAVYDIHTGEEVLRDEAMITLGKDRLYVSNSQTTSVDIYELENLTLLTSVPNLSMSLRVSRESVGEYYQVQAPDGGAGMIDHDGNIIIPPEYYGVSPINDQYVAGFRNWENVLYTWSGQEVMRINDGTIEGFNGTEALVNLQDNLGVCCVDVAGTRRQLPYSSVYKSYGNGKKERDNGACTFMAWIETQDPTTGFFTNEFVMLDAQFNEICRFPDTVSSVWYHADGWYLAAENEQINGYDETGVKRLENVVSVGVNETEDFLDTITCMNADETYNIYDFHGNLVAANMPKGKTCCNNKYYLARKGFSYGLMDLAQNWIYEYSVFTEMED